MTEKAVGGGGEPESNNLVYRKRLKDMYANRKHETTSQNKNPPKKSFKGIKTISLYFNIYKNKLVIHKKHKL